MSKTISDIISSIIDNQQLVVDKISALNLTDRYLTKQDGIELAKQDIDYIECIENPGAKNLKFSFIRNNGDFQSTIIDAVIPETLISVSSNLYNNDIKSLSYENNILTITKNNDSILSTTIIAGNTGNYLSAANPSGQGTFTIDNINAKENISGTAIYANGINLYDNDITAGSFNNDILSLSSINKQINININTGLHKVTSVSAISTTQINDHQQKISLNIDLSDRFLSQSDNGLKTTLNLVKASTVISDLPTSGVIAAQYYLTDKNNQQVGPRIDIPKDQFLSGAVYDKDTHTLILVMYLSGQSDMYTSTYIPLTNLFNIYQASSGIQKLDDGKTFVGKINNIINQKYLTLSQNGFAITGINNLSTTLHNYDIVSGNFDRIQKELILTRYDNSSLNPIKIDAEDLGITTLTGNNAISAYADGSAGYVSLKLSDNTLKQSQTGLSLNIITTSGVFLNGNKLYATIDTNNNTEGYLILNENGFAVTGINNLSTTLHNYDIISGRFDRIQKELILTRYNDSTLNPIKIDVEDLGITTLTGNNAISAYADGSKGYINLKLSDNTLKQSQAGLALNIITTSGILLDGNKLYATIDTTNTEEYLILSQNGFAVTGINNALSSLSAYTYEQSVISAKDYTDSICSGLSGSVTGLINSVSTTLHNQDIISGSFEKDSKLLTLSRYDQINPILININLDDLGITTLTGKDSISAYADGSSGYISLKLSNNTLKQSQLGLALNLNATSGVFLNGNQLYATIDINNNIEGYLTLNENGFAVTGINNTLSALSAHTYDKSVISAKDYTDSIYSRLSGSVTGLINSVSTTLYNRDIISGSFDTGTLILSTQFNKTIQISGFEPEGNYLSSHNPSGTGMLTIDTISAATIYSNNIDLYKNTIRDIEFNNENNLLSLKRYNNTDLSVTINIQGGSGSGIHYLESFGAISTNVNFTNNTGYISLKLSDDTLQQSQSGLALNLNVTSGISLDGNKLYSTIDTNNNEDYLILSQNGFAVTGINNLSTTLHNYDIVSGNFDRIQKELILTRYDDSTLNPIKIDVEDLGITTLTGMDAISAYADGSAGYISLKLSGNTLQQSQSGLSLNIITTSGVFLNGNQLYATIDTNNNIEGYLTLNENGFAVTGINNALSALSAYTYDKSVISAKDYTDCICSGLSGLTTGLINSVSTILYNQDIISGSFTKENKQLILTRYDNNNLNPIIIDIEDTDTGITGLIGKDAISAYAEGTSGYISLKLNNTGNVNLSQDNNGLKANIDVASGIKYQNNKFIGQLNRESGTDPYLTLDKDGFKLAGVRTDIQTASANAYSLASSYTDRLSSTVTGLINSVSTILYNRDIITGSFDNGTLTLSTQNNKTIQISGFEPSGNYLSAVNPSGQGTLTINDIKVNNNISANTFIDVQHNKNLYNQDINTIIFNRTTNILELERYDNSKLSAAIGTTQPTTAIISTSNYTLDYNTNDKFILTIDNSAPSSIQLIVSNLAYGHSIVMRITVPSGKTITFGNNNTTIIKQEGGYYGTFVNLGSGVQLVGEPVKVFAIQTN